MKITTKGADTVLKIRRPNGNIETVTIQHIAWGDSMFQRAKRDTAAAGRGDILSYRIVPRKVSPLNKARLEATLAEERMDVPAMVKANLKIRELTRQAGPSSN